MAKRKLPRSAIYVGIDPGVKGAIGLYIPQHQKVFAIDLASDIRTCFNRINNLKTDYIVKKIMVENVSSVPGTSANSNFKFGRSAGIAEAIAACSGYGYDLVRPKAWQKEIGVPQGKKFTPTQLKKEVANICLRLFPNANIKGPRGGLLDGRSDAIMLAYYAYLK